MNKIYRIIWSKARNCYVVVSEIAKRSGKSSSSLNKKLIATFLAAGTVLSVTGSAWAGNNTVTIKGNGNSAPNVTNSGGDNAVIIGKTGATHGSSIVVIGDGAKNSTDLTSLNGSRYDYLYGDRGYHSDGGRIVYNGSNGIAIGTKAWSHYVGGDADMALFFGKSLAELPEGIAIGTNSYARNGSIMLGQHDYTGPMGDTTVEAAKNNKTNLSVASTTIGYASSNMGNLATLTGSYSVISDFNEGNKSSERNAGAVVYGSLNSIESKKTLQGDPASRRSGIANSVVGVANRTNNANTAMIFGAGNQISNSIVDVTPSFYQRPGKDDDGKALVVGYAQNALELQNKMMKHLQKDKGGSVIAIGTGNTADSTIFSQLNGVGNTLSATTVVNTQKASDTDEDTYPVAEAPKAEDYISAYNQLSGYANQGTDVRHVTVAGAANTIKNTTGAIVTGDNNSVTGSGIPSAKEEKYDNILLIGNNRTVTGAKNTVVLGSGKTTTTAENAVIIGQDANAEVDGGVALGKDSIASTPAGTTTKTSGYDPSGKDHKDDTTGTWVSTASAVSVGGGSSADGKKVTRQITNVAAGSDPTDAVNVAQLKAAMASSGGIHDYGVNSIDPDTDTNYENKGATGDNALAAGVSAKAEGIVSTAVGYNAHAIGGTALAVGTSVTATGNQSVAIGTSANAEKDSSIAIGTGVSAKGPNSIAIGTGVTAEGQGAIALGSNGALAKGNGSMAFGQGSTAEGDYSTAFGGGGARATATAATAFGVQTHAATNQSTAFGYGTYAGGLVTGTSINRGIRGGVPSKVYFYVKNGNTSVRVDENKRELYVFRNEAATLYGGQFVYKSDKGNPIVIDSNGKIYNVKADSDGNLLRDTLNTTDKIVTLSGEFLENTKVSNATAWGEGTKAINYQATAWGAHTLARGANSTAWGSGSQALGDLSTAFGANTVASGANATAFGSGSVAKGALATAFGAGTQANGPEATSFGTSTKADGEQSTAFGSGTWAKGTQSTVWGTGSRAFNAQDTSWGTATLSNGPSATAFGTSTAAIGPGATAWGTNARTIGVTVNGQPAKLSGSPTGYTVTYDGKRVANLKFETDGYWGTWKLTKTEAGAAYNIYGPYYGDVATAWGNNTAAYGSGATAWGMSTISSGTASTAFGLNTQATMAYATAWGQGTKATADQSTAFGLHTEATYSNATAFGAYTAATQYTATAFGSNTRAEASYATAWGDHTRAKGERSTAFGGYSVARGTYTIASGQNTTAWGNADVTWGTGTVAHGSNATSFGQNTAAVGQSAVSWGQNTTAGRVLYNGKPAILSIGYKTNNSTGQVEATYRVIDQNHSVLTEVTVGEEEVVPYGQTALERKLSEAGVTVGGFAATAFGSMTVASGEMATAFGQKTLASGGASTAFGAGTKATQWADTAFGQNTEASGGASTAFGTETKAKGWADTSFGQKTVAQGGASTAFGTGTLASGWADTAFGQTSYARGGAGIAAGLESRSFGWTSVALGQKSVAAAGNSLAALGGHTGGWYWENEYGFGVEEGKGYGSVSIGEGSQAYENYTYALGQNAKTTANAANAVAIGNNATVGSNWSTGTEVPTDHGVAIGYGAVTYATDGLAVGTGANASGVEAIAIGHGSEVYGEKSIAIGTGNKIYGAKSSVIGDPNTLSGEDNHAHGNDNNIYVDHGYILGSESSVGLTSSVALGYQSATGETLYATPSMTVNGTKYDFAGGAPVGTVSVGAEGKERTITNVAAGRISATSTDAINGSQLYFAIQALNEKVVVESGDSSVNVDSKVEPEDAAGAGTTGSGTISGGATDAGNTESGTTTGGNDTTTTGGNTGATAGGDSGEIEPTRTTTYIVTANTTTAEAGSDNLTVEDSNPGGDDKTHHYTIDLAKDIHVTNVTVDNSVKVGDKTTIEGDQITTKTVNGDTINTKTINLGDTTIEEGDDNHITYKKGGNTYNIATVEDGMDYAGDDGKAIHKNLAEQLDIVGGAADKASEYNIYTYNDGDKLRINLAKDIKGVDSVTVNKTVKVGDKTTIEGDKITVGDTVIEGDQITTKTVKAGDTTINNDGFTIKNGPSITKNGIDVGGKKITNVAPGTDGTDAVNVNQLREANQDIYNSMNRLDNSTRKGIAGAAALAALHPLDFDPDDKWEFSAGVGNYRGETAAAIGAFYHPNDDTIFSLGATVGNGENLVNGGVTFRFGQNNHQSRSKKAMAKEIVELRAEVAELKAMVYSMANGRMPGLDLTKSEEFPDTPENHWAYDYVSVLAGNGVLEGYQDGFFKGDRTLTRYEMAAIIYRAMMRGVDVDERMKEEFAPELARVKVDTLTSHSDGTPSIQRVRVIKGRE